jgi:hypothetical protein
MTMIETYRRKDRCEFYTNDGYFGAIKAYHSASKSTLSDLKRREWPKRSERKRVKAALARKRLKKQVRKKPAEYHRWKCHKVVDIKRGMGGDASSATRSQHRLAISAHATTDFSSFKDKHE